METFNLDTVTYLVVIAAAVIVAIVSLILLWKPDSDPVKIAALIIAMLGVYLTATTLTAKRNADLVKIGVSVLRVDPEKEKQISAAREWALKLIDANAGGVKFSKEAKEQLLKEPLGYDLGYTGASDLGYVDTFGVKPAPRRPSPEPPK